MLVKLKQLREDESGIALVMVVGAILLLSLTGAAMLSNVTFASNYTTQTAQKVYARAAADAGVDVMTAEFAQGHLFPCGHTISEDDPRFTVQVMNYVDAAGELIPCAMPLNDIVPRSAQVVATGWAPDSDTTITVMAEIATPAGGDGAAFVSGSNSTIDGVRLPAIVGGSADVIVQEGTLTCNVYSEIHGNVIVNGNVTFTNNCEVMGNMIIAGTANFSSAVKIHGDLIVAGKSDAGVSVSATNVPITVGGNLYANGHIAGSLWSANSAAQIKVAGDLYTRGSVNLFMSSVGGDLWAGGDFRTQESQVGGDVLVRGSLASFIGTNTRIDGYLRVGGDLSAEYNICPTGGGNNAALAACLKSTRVKSGIVEYGVPNVPLPPERQKPTVPTWIDIPFVQSDWALEGFDFRPYNASDIGCGFANWDSASKTRVESITKPTVIDLRPCGSSLYMQGDLRLRTDIVFLVQGAMLHGQIRAFNPSNPIKVWFLVPDQVVNAQPTCSGGAGDIRLQGAKITEGIQALLYTPCTIYYGGASDVAGRLYAGKTNVNGTNNVLRFEPTPVPGVDLGAGADGGDLDKIFVRARFDVTNQ